MVELYLNTGKDVLGNAQSKDPRIKELFEKNVQLFYRPDEEILFMVEGKAAGDSEFFYFRKSISQTTNFENIKRLLDSYDLDWEIDHGDEDFNADRFGEIHNGEEVSDSLKISDPSLDTRCFITDSIQEAFRVFNKLRKFKNQSLIISENTQVSLSFADIETHIIVREGAEKTPRRADPEEIQALTPERDSNKESTTDSGFKYSTDDAKQNADESQSSKSSPQNADAEDSPQTAGENKSGSKKQSQSNHQNKNDGKMQQSGGSDKTSEESSFRTASERDSTNNQSSVQEETTSTSQSSSGGSTKDQEEKAESKTNSSKSFHDTGSENTDRKSDWADNSSDSLIPNNARLEVFDGPTGEKYFDSEGEASGTNKSMQNMYHDDVTLYYSPQKNTVICYLNAQRNSPQQFIARYSAPGKIGDELLRGFKKAVQTWLIEDAGWSFVENAGVKQVIFDGLVDAVPLEPDYSETEFEAMKDASPVHFMTPNEPKAIRLFQYFREQTQNNAVIAISSSGKTEEIEPAEYIIQPGFTEDDAKPMDDSETKQMLADHRFSKNIETGRQKIRQMVKNIPESIPISHRQATLAEAINDETLEGQDFVVADSNIKRRFRAASDLVTMVVAVVVVVLGIGYFSYSGMIGEAISAFGSQTEVGLPGSSQLPSVVANFTISAQDSTFIGGMVVLTLLGIVTLGALTIPFKRLLRYFQLGLPFSTSKMDTNPEEKSKMDTLSKEGDSLGEVLIELQEDYKAADQFDEDSKSYQEIIKSKVFDPVDRANLNLLDQSSIKLDRRRYLTLGGIIGILIGLGLNFVAYAFFQSISSSPSMVAMASAYVLGIYVIAILISGVYFVLRSSVDWRNREH